MANKIKEPELHYIFVEDDSYTKTIGELDPKVEWSKKDTYTTHNIEGIYEVPEKYYHYGLPITFPLDKSRTYYLLYAIYSTGDSFSHHEGKIEFIDLYEDVETANVSAKIIEKTYLYDYKESYQEFPYKVEIIASNGKVNKINVPWAGYFERLTSINVKPVRVLK